MHMKVFKFGGASVNNIERIQNIPVILQQYQEQPLTVIISAMGKTTNALEKVAETFYKHQKTEALQLFDVIKKQHITTAKYLLVTCFNKCLQQLTDFFTEIEWLLHDDPVRDYDYYYDQIVCIGELLSTCIISHYLNEQGISNTWIDVRDVLKTDNNFRDATVDVTSTEKNILSVIQPNTGNIYLTQGFIGSTDENESTTLGREGSDYTAAIFANALNAESLTIWKDVDGVMNADPKKTAGTILLKELSFEEVIEMAYYGAQVIHPKTIKPLQNKHIPLFVRSFIDPSLPGTVIQSHKIKKLPPIIVLKEKQALLQLSSIDFSFVGEAPMARLYAVLNQLHIKPNLLQTGAISIFICMDEQDDKIQKLASSVSDIFDLQVEKNLTLITIRHYNAEVISKMLQDKKIVLEQKTTTTIQCVVNN